MFAHSIVAAATSAGATVGVIPIPIPDSVILSGTDAAVVSVVVNFTILGMTPLLEGGDSKNNSSAGNGRFVGKGGCGCGQSHSWPQSPAAALVNAVIAGIVMATIGEISVHAYEQVYTGAKTLDDIDWLKNWELIIWETRF